VVSLIGSTTTSNSGCSQTVYQTWQALDQCYGASNTCVRVVTVGFSPPTLLCSNLTITCGSQIPTNPPAWIDVCCSNVLVSLISNSVSNNGCSQTIYQTWMATDCCGNSNTCLRMVSIVAGLGLHNLVVPNANANVQGDGGNSDPFDIGRVGYSNWRYQQVYDKSQFGAVPAGGAYITALAFRVAAGWSAFAAT